MKKLKDKFKTNKTKYGFMQMTIYCILYIRKHSNHGNDRNCKDYGELMDDCISLWNTDVRLEFFMELWRIISDDIKQSIFSLKWHFRFFCISRENIFFLLYNL